MNLYYPLPRKSGSTILSFPVQMFNLSNSDQKECMGIALQQGNKDTFTCQNVTLHFTQKFRANICRKKFTSQNKKQHILLPQTLDAKYAPKITHHWNSISLCRGQKPASKMHQTCILNTGHMRSFAGPVLAPAVWTDRKKNYSYRTGHTMKTGQSRLLPPILLSSLTLGSDKSSGHVNSVRVCALIFCDNAIPGDIPFISLFWKIDGTPWYLVYTPGTSVIYFVRLPNRLCSSPPWLGFYWNLWGKTTLPQTLMPTSYKQTLIQYDPIYTKIWALAPRRRTLRKTVVSGPIWPKFELVRDFMHVLARYLQV